MADTSAAEAIILSNASYNDLNLSKGVPDKFVKEQNVQQPTRSVKDSDTSLKEALVLASIS